MVNKPVGKDGTGRGEGRGHGGVVAVKTGVKEGSGAGHGGRNYCPGLLSRDDRM